MSTNPKPMDAIWYRKPQCPVIEANSDAVIFTISNRLEMQRWVRRIGFELSVIPVCEGLNVRG